MQNRKCLIILPLLVLLCCCQSTITKVKIMGTEIPTEWPDLDPAKFYFVEVEVWLPTFPLTYCGGIYLRNVTCCVSGAWIIDWVQNDRQCIRTEMCVELGASEQKIVWISDPFDDNMCSIPTE